MSDTLYHVNFVGRWTPDGPAGACRVLGAYPAHAVPEALRRGRLDAFRLGWGPGEVVVMDEDGDLVDPDAPADPGVERTVTALLLTDWDDIEDAEVAAWTPEQRREAWEWAWAEHLHASDNDDVRRLPRPSFLPPPKDWAARRPAAV